MLVSESAQGDEGIVKSAQMPSLCEIVELQIGIDVLAFHCLCQRLECHLFGSLDVSSSAVAFIGGVFERAADKEAELVDDLHLMQSAIYARTLLLQVPHALHSCNPDGFSVFEGMPVSLGHSRHCPFSNADILQHHFHCLFSVFVQNLEFFAEVIEDLSVGSVAIGRNEVDFAISAKLVDFQLLFMGQASSNNHLEPAHQGKICRIVVKFTDLYIVIQFLQLVDSAF